MTVKSETLDAFNSILPNFIGKPVTPTLAKQMAAAFGAKVSVMAAICDMHADGRIVMRVYPFDADGYELVCTSQQVPA